MALSALRSLLERERASIARTDLVDISRQRALGHRQITTTEVYAKVGDEALRAAVTVL